MDAIVVFFEFYIVRYDARNDGGFLEIWLKLVIMQCKEFIISRRDDNKRRDDKWNNGNVRTMNSFHIYNYIFAHIFNEA